jgi:H(+)-transporting ATP synthase subunit D
MATRKNNRSTLLALRVQKTMVAQGIDTLTAKRDALMTAFGQVIREVATARTRLDNTLHTAAQAQIIAEGLERTVDIQSAADAATRPLPVTVTIENIWGVKIPQFTLPDGRRTLLDRGSAPLYRSPMVDETAARFEVAINALVISATLETKLAKLGSAVRSANRRLNALQQKVAPQIAADIKRIEAYLEEQAREEVFRLKRFKAKQVRTSSKTPVS